MHPAARAKIKAQLKELAVDLRDSKKSLRQHMKENTYKVSEQYKVLGAKKLYRHQHLAYCLLRGRKLEEVEFKVSPDNLADMALVEKYLAEFKALDATFPPKPEYVKRQPE